MNYTMRAIFSVFLFYLTFGGSYILELKQAVADGLPIIDIKAWAHDAELTLPANQTRLQVAASQTHQGLNPLTYRWVKVSGPPLGEVTFLPNGNKDADITTATFRGNVAGIYTLRVIVSDGLQKESISEVEVLINPRRSDARSGNAKIRVERDGGRKVMTRADRVIVRFEIDTNEKEGSLRLSAASLAVMDSLGAKVSKTWLEGRFGLVELAPGVNYQVAVDRLQALPEIRYAVADQSIMLDQYVPNDSQFDAQWGLKNTAGVDIRATFVWDQTTGNAHSLVAVMDTGIDYTHPDLYLAIAINNGEIPTSLLGQLIDTNSNGLIDFYDLNSRNANGDIILDEFGEKFNQALVSDHNGNGYIDAGDLQVPSWSDQIDGDGNGYVDDLSGWNILNDSYDAMDTHGHGTHVTGIIAGRGDNGIGIAGINWRTQILPVQFHDGGGGSVSDAIQAIEYAVLLNPDVINASWGTVIDNPALKEAVQWAGDNGVVFVAAAGNGSNDIGDPAFAYYPAAYHDLTNLISVASVDPSGSLSSFSNYGLNSVDLAAPGASILSTGLGGSYVFWSGTSMGVAHVSGTVSLLAGLFPDKSPDWLVNRVLSTVKTLPDLEFKTRTGGMVDTFSAVNTPSLAGPRIVIANPIGDVLEPTDRVFLTFDSAMLAPTFTIDDIEIVGPSGSITPTAVNKITDFIFEIVFPLQATVGTYTLHVGPEIQDNLGRLMDQDRDGNIGESLHDRFTVVFRLLPPPTALILDDGEAGYSASGGWTTYTGVGTQGDFAYKVVGSGTNTATWTLSGLLPGQYQVAVTWQAYINRPLDARYTILDGATALGTVTVDQRQDPVGLVENGVLWQDVGVYELTGDTLVVRLSDLAGPAGSYVIADAVRVERVGEGTPGPEVQVRVSGGEVPDGTGSVDFGSTVVGTPVSQTITVSNVGTVDLQLGTITLPTGYSLVTGFGTTLVSPGQTTNFVVQLDAGVVGTYGGALSFDSNDADENPFDFSVSGTVTGGTVQVPEIQVRVGGGEVSDGTGSVGFGSTVVGRPVSQTITVSNVGTVDLQLGTITLPTGYSLVTGFGTTLVGPGQTTNFVVQLDAGAVGTYTGVLSFDSNDADENPFDFSVSGTVAGALPLVSILDDGEAGYSASGGWTTYTGVGTQGDFAYKVVGSGTNTATWTLSGLLPGQYQVAVTWQAYINRPLDARYTILDGATALGTVTVDQRQDPVGLVENGVLWQDVGVYHLTGDTLVVRLSDLAGPAGSYVIADAVRVERVGEGTPGPEVQVRVSGGEVPDGTGSVDFGSTVVGTPVSQTITVSNVGTVDLQLGTITLSTGYSLVTGFGTTLVSPGQTTNFVVQLDAGVVGTYGGVLSFDSNDADENPFDFSVSGTVMGGTVQVPEIQVRVGGGEVSDGTGSVGFGSTVVGTPVSQTITVSNVGTVDLQLGTITLPTGYSLVTGFGTTLVGPGQTTNFVVQLDAGAVGTYTGVLSFDSNDADENPFDFSVSGTVAGALPLVSILDDGEAGYSASGGWTTYTGVGTQGDFAYKAVGSGTDTATWTLSGLLSGEYQVAVTWQAYPNRPLDARYTVLDGATALGTVTVDQRQDPVGLVENGVLWQDVGVYHLTGDTLVVRLSDLAGPAGSYVIADAVRVERVGEGTPGPEVQVRVGGGEVPDGTGSVGFGSTVVGTPVSQTITISNVGTVDLQLGTITLPTGYSLVAGFGTTLVGPGQTTNFVVQLDAGVVGTYGGVLSFDSNDADENPFDFSVSGTVTGALPLVSILDDGEAGYSASAGWNTYTGVGMQGDFAYKAVGSGTNTATWTLSGLLPGQYQVAVTWQAYPNRAIDAPYTVLDGATALGTVTVDQRQDPVGLVENGVLWQDVGVYELTGDTLVVRLSDLGGPAGSYVIADAVRVERVGEMQTSPP